LFKFFTPQSRKRLPDLPEGMRIYAVGDVHGRADLLERAFARIDADLVTRSTIRPIQVFLGDYIDRGPMSRDVLEHLIARGHSHETVFLKGNHETYLVEFLRNPAILEDWQQWGGLETLMSYGLKPSLHPDAKEQTELAAALEQALPKAHQEFLANLPLCSTWGNYFFVHAGVRPHVPLEQQLEKDLLWIRDDFLLHEGDFGKIVVHGHTPVQEPDIRPNRINIDTGAYATGKLTCLVIDQDTVEIL
jgi:serine/threonine protein phosphatase 1